MQTVNKKMCSVFWKAYAYIFFFAHVVCNLVKFLCNDYNALA